MKKTIIALVLIGLIATGCGTQENSVQSEGTNQEVVFEAQETAQACDRPNGTILSGYITTDVYYQNSSQTHYKFKVCNDKEVFKMIVDPITYNMYLTGQLDQVAHVTKSYNPSGQELNE